jgi:tetratricopeptide (TPR) repeat protein
MTGQGNLKEAHAAALEYYKQLEERATSQNWIPIGFFKYGENDKEGALKAYRNAMDQTKSPLAALLSALIMDQEHRDTERDELLAGIAKLTPPEETRKEMVRLAAVVQASVANPEHKLDVEAIENLANVSSEDSRDEIFLVAGQYLENRGERKKAIEYYRRSADMSGWNFPKLGAAMQMRELERQEAR